MKKVFFLILSVLILTLLIASCDKKKAEPDVTSATVTEETAPTAQKTTAATTVSVEPGQDEEPGKYSSIHTVG